MPSVEQILDGLKNITNSWIVLAVFWHFYFAVLSVALLSGARPSKRIAGILVSLPLLSVSIVSWLSSNPFNGIVYIILFALLLYFSYKLPEENIRIGHIWMLATGLLMIIFGWMYPHFLDTGSLLSYIYKSPAGLIPCPTLSVVTGFTLLLGCFNSRAFSLTLAIAGLYYGITGALQFKVYIDWILLAGAVILFISAFMKSREAEVKPAPKMTQMGVGPRLALISSGYILFVLAVHFNSPRVTRMTQDSYIFFPAAAIVLILFGLFMWISGGRIIDKAFKEGRLLTTGVYSIVRNPMYSGFIVFISTGIALWLRSWPFLTVPFVLALSFHFLIKSEEEYLEQKFGKEWDEYKARTKQLVPFIR